MARLFTLPAPEDGEERDVYWMVNHRCPQGNALRSALGDDVDQLIFPVGVMGTGMPAGVAFEVQTPEPCGACGKVLRAWFEWKKRLVVPL